MGILNDVKVLMGKKDDIKSQTSKNAPRPQKTILIVEDERPLANVLEDRFVREGYNVVKALDGKEGLEMVVAHHPDIILLDLMMPVMSGKSMLIQLREMPEYKKLPVIVLTNAGETDNIKVTQHYFNAVDFLIKSNVTLDYIVERVKNFVY